MKEKAFETVGGIQTDLYEFQVMEGFFLQWQCKNKNQYQTLSCTCER